LRGLLPPGSALLPQSVKKRIGDLQAKECGFFGPGIKIQSFLGVEKMKKTEQASKTVVQRQSIVCPKCGGTEFSVGFTGKLVLNTANDEIGIWDTDYMEDVGTCTLCYTKTNLKVE
jgi:RNA polymerase subunit RPABC4/transcription elongation factor Spt4